MSNLSRLVDLYAQHKEVDESIPPLVEIDDSKCRVRCFYCKDTAWASKFWSPFGRTVLRQHCSRVCLDRYNLLYRSSPLVRLEHALANLDKQLASATIPITITRLNERRLILERGIVVAARREAESTALTLAKAASKKTNKPLKS